MLIVRTSVYTTDHMSWLSSHKPPLCTKIHARKYFWIYTKSISIFAKTPLKSVFNFIQVNWFNGFHNICIENKFIGFPPAKNYYRVKKRFEEHEFKKFKKLFSQVNFNVFLKKILALFSFFYLNLAFFSIFLRTETYVLAFNGWVLYFYFVGVVINLPLASYIVPFMMTSFLSIISI